VRLGRRRHHRSHRNEDHRELRRPNDPGHRLRLGLEAGFFSSDIPVSHWKQGASPPHAQPLRARRRPARPPKVPLRAATRRRTAANRHARQRPESARSSNPAADTALRAAATRKRRGLHCRCRAQRRRRRNPPYASRSPLLRRPGCRPRRRCSSAHGACTNSANSLPLKPSETSRPPTAATSRIARFGSPSSTRARSDSVRQAAAAYSSGSPSGTAGSAARTSSPTASSSSPRSHNSLREQRVRVALIDRVDAKRRGPARG
jgi:hypothetical protein